jgi:hypothetical protein
MSENKRNTPMSELDLQMMMTDPAWGSGNISEDLKEKLNNILSENEQEITYENLWDLLGYYQRDMRLGNLDRWNGEFQYCHWYLDFAGDCLHSNYIRSFITALSRVATVLELSQSKGGFLRRLPTQQEHKYKEESDEEGSGFFGLRKNKRSNQ